MKLTTELLKKLIREEIAESASSGSRWRKHKSDEIEY